MNRAEKIDLLRAAQRLAAVSDGKISADNAIKSLIREGLTEDIPGVGYRGDVEAEEMYSFGANQDDLQSDGGMDLGDYERLLAQEKSDLADDMIAAKRTKDYAGLERLRKERDRLSIREAELPAAASAGRVAPKSVLADALRTLQEGTGVYGFDSFPGAADTAGRLEETLQDGKISREAATSLASELVRRDSQRFQSFWKNVNNVKAQIRYEQALRNGEIVTPDLFSKPDSRYRPSAVIIPDQEQLVRGSNQVPYGPMELNEYGIINNLSWQNTGSRGRPDLATPPVQGAALPKRQVSEFINRSFNTLEPNKFSPQVSINEALGKLNKGIADLGGTTKVSNAAELTDFAKKYLTWAKEKEMQTGKSPIVSWRNGGTRPAPIPVSTATIDDVLTSLDVGAEEQKRLGYALGQIAIAGNDRVDVTEDIMYDSGAGNPYDRKIEYQRITGDNRSAPGTRGVSGSTPPVRTYMTGAKGRTATGPAVYDPQRGAYRAMPRTQLTKLFDQLGVKGPQALLEDDRDLDRTKLTYNKFGVTDSPRELRKLIVDQAAERAQRTGKELNLYGALQNADKAIAVTRRARRDNAARKEHNRVLMQFGPYNRLLRGGF